jgi:hypothetical protein
VRHRWFEGGVDDTSYFESRYEFKPGVDTDITLDITLARAEGSRGKRASAPNEMTAFPSLSVAQLKGKNKANMKEFRASHTPRPRLSTDNRWVTSQLTSLNLGLLRGKRSASLKF